MTATSPFPKLTKDSTIEVRCEVANKIASEFAGGEFSINEKRIAIEIFRVLVNDVEKNVRKILSERLASCIYAPHDVILKLANDETEIAIPVVKNSFVLTESDLVSIINKSQDIGVLSAIARREIVSRELSEALIKKSNVTALTELLDNKNANIDEKGLFNIYNGFHKNSSILEAMAKRGSIPLPLAEKLFVAVSDEVKRVLTTQYNISFQAADDSAAYAREMATLGLLDEDASGIELSELVAHLRRSGRLSLSIIIRSLCLGNLRFFEHAIAELSGVPYMNTRILILDTGGGFEALYKKTALPPEIEPAIAYLLKAALSETVLGRFQRSDFKQRIVERLVRDDAAKTIEYMDYIVRIMQQNSFDSGI